MWKTVGNEILRLKRNQLKKERVGRMPWLLVKRMGDTRKKGRKKGGSQVRGQNSVTEEASG